MNVFNECRKYSIPELTKFAEARTPGARSIVVEHAGNAVTVRVYLGFFSWLLFGYKMKAHLQKEIDENVIMIGKTITVKIN